MRYVRSMVFDSLGDLLGEDLVVSKDIVGGDLSGLLLGVLW